jgi:hypothetical protein
MLNLRKGTILHGKINDLANNLADGWRRRDITVWQDPTGCYPGVGDGITLIDADGDRYKSIFTKPEEYGHVCLGKPKSLESWYKKHYAQTEVENDTVYFEYTGRDAEFLIYASKQRVKK